MLGIKLHKNAGLGASRGSAPKFTVEHNASQYMAPSAKHFIASFTFTQDLRSIGQYDRDSLPVGRPRTSLRAPALLVSWTGPAR